jgi:hypothetical protein
VPPTFYPLKMRIGAILRCDHTGLGVQSKEFFNHIPCKALVIDFSSMAPGLSEILNPNLHWYAGQTVFKWGSKHNLRGDIPRHIIEEFVKDIDVLVAMETPYDYNIFEICRQRGVKTVLQLNYEFLDFPSNLPKPDLFLSPSQWNYNSIPEPKKYLPVPVNTKVFQPKIKPNSFLHIVGRPAAHDRNGTQTLLAALNYVKSEIELVIKSQRPISFSVPRNFKGNVTVDCSNKTEYFENYTGGVLVMPRKFGGLCLPINEAIGAEMPVIAPDISPNDMWLPPEWLVSATYSKTFSAKKTVDIFETDVIKLAEKIDQFCELKFYSDAIDIVRCIKKTISWEVLLPCYIDTFNNLL